jgi:glycosyltransferase involved in cell wall biosynthesis
MDKLAGVFASGSLLKDARSHANLRITHISAYDSAGGAARAAYRLHTGLLSVGQESIFLVQQKNTDDDTVHAFSPPVKVSTQVRRMIKRHLLPHNRRPFNSRPAGSTYMSDDRSVHNADVLGQVPPTDILNLHWVAGYFEYISFFRNVPFIPIVWTLHDMNPFTGGCHFDGGCGKFKQHCGACPQIDSSKPNDLSAHVWKRKKEAFARLATNRMHLVAPSRWLASEAKKSSLFGHLPVSVIPYGLETDRFQPRDRGFARQLFEIPAEAKVVLFVADWAHEKRKGLDLLLEALRGLGAFPDLYAFAVGHNISSKVLGVRSKTINYVRDDLTLSLMYSCADVFVLPSLEDNLPLTALEALACGIPTVAFSVGGIPDIVRDGQTGILTTAGDVEALRRAVAELLLDPERRASMSHECRRVAMEEYRLDVQAGRYAALYKELAEKAAGQAARTTYNLRAVVPTE